MSRKTFWIGLASAAIIVAATYLLLWPRSEWTQDEITTLRGLWIGSLSALPPDLSNIEMHAVRKMYRPRGGPAVVALALNLRLLNVSRAEPSMDDVVRQL